MPDIWGYMVDSRLRGSTCFLLAGSFFLRFFIFTQPIKHLETEGNMPRGALYYSLSVTQYFSSIPQRIANILLTLFKGSPTAFSRLSQRVRGYMWPFRLHFPPSNAFAFLMIKKTGGTTVLIMYYPTILTVARLILLRYTVWKGHWMIFVFLNFKEYKTVWHPKFHWKRV